jgi:hypothetical protein
MGDRKLAVQIRVEQMRHATDRGFGRTVLVEYPQLAGVTPHGRTRKIRLEIFATENHGVYARLRQIHALHQGEVCRCQLEDVDTIVRDDLQHGWVATVGRRGVDHERAS